MSNLAPSLPSHLLTYCICSCHLHHFLVWHMLLPSDAEDSSYALGLKEVKLPFLSLCHLPRFTAIEEHWKHLSLEKRCLCFLLMFFARQILMSLLKLAYARAVLVLMSNVAPPSFVTCGSSRWNSSLPPPCYLLLSVPQYSCCWSSSTCTFMVSASSLPCLHSSLAWLFSPA